MDEPTSGLDSVNSFLVMDRISKLCHEKQACVMMSLHSPPNAMLQMLSAMMILQEGTQVFYGSIAEAEEFSLAHSHLGVQFDFFMCPINDDSLTVADKLLFLYHSIPGSINKELKLKDPKSQTSFSSIFEYLKILISSRFVQINRKSPCTPFWRTLRILLQYRAVKKYSSPMFYASRLLDKATYTYDCIAMTVPCKILPPCDQCGDLFLHT